MISQMTSASRGVLYAVLFMARLARRLTVGIVMICTTLTSPIWSQWTGGPTGPVYYNGGNVGIGTVSPLNGTGLSGGFHVYGTAVNTGAIVAETTGDGSYVFTKNGSGALWKGFVGSRNNGTWDFFVGQYGLSGGTLAFYTDNGGSLAERMRINSSGNVGIGTTSPAVQLHLGSSDSGTTNWGNRSGAVLRLTNTFAAANVGGEIQFSQYTFPSYAAITSVYQNGTGNSLGSLAISTRQAFGDANLTPRLWVNYDGNVGIGTTNPQAKLAVNGTITTKEVIVTNTGWSDYVFNPEYALKPLTEVANFIKENHHLPEIPSEKEVRDKGVSLGEMQAKLLAKIEELTLHMIQAEERNNKLEQKNLELQEQNREIRERVVSLEAKTQ